MIAVLHNTKRGNNLRAASLVAERLECVTLAAEDAPDISDFDTIVFVVPNHGDEELPAEMEAYLLRLPPSRKKFYVCELGNYFGFGTYSGCKTVVSAMLRGIGWTELGNVSVDSLPDLDEQSIIAWLDRVFPLL